MNALGGMPRHREAELIAQRADLLAAEEGDAAPPPRPRHRRRSLLTPSAQGGVNGLDRTRVEVIYVANPAFGTRGRRLTKAAFDSRTLFRRHPQRGQPKLSRRLQMGAFAALDQRIATRFAFTGMDLGESRVCLQHQLTLADRTDLLVADDHAASAASRGQWPASATPRCYHRRRS